MPVAVTELLELRSLDDPVVEAVAVPEAPIEVPLPVALASVDGVVPAVVPASVEGVVPAVLDDVDEVSALVVGAGAGTTVVLLEDVEVSGVDASRWHAVRDSAAIRARAAQRAMGIVVIRTLLERL